LRAAVGDNSSAEQVLRSVVNESPDYLPAYEALGQILLRQRNVNAAQQEYEKLALRMPKAVGAQTVVGVLHQMQGREQEARTAYAKVLSIDPRAVVANNNLAYSYADEGRDLQTALQMAQAAKAGRPDDPDVNDTLGWVYYKLGMHMQAISPLLQSTRINPNKAIYHYHLGLAYEGAGERDKARASLERAVSLGEFAEAPAAKKALESLR
jgi:Flp pilus assembly protein TadD